MENVLAQGRCCECPQDTYLVYRAGEAVIMDFTDGDFDENVCIYFTEEKALELAHAIINSYK